MGHHRAHVARAFPCCLRSVCSSCKNLLNWHVFCYIILRTAELPPVFTRTSHSCQLHFANHAEVSSARCRAAIDCWATRHALHNRLHTTSCIRPCMAVRRLLKSHLASIDMLTASSGSLLSRLSDCSCESSAFHRNSGEASISYACRSSSGVACKSYVAGQSHSSPDSRGQHAMRGRCSGISGSASVSISDHVPRPHSLRLAFRVSRGLNVPMYASRRDATVLQVSDRHQGGMHAGQRRWSKTVLGGSSHVAGPCSRRPRHADRLPAKAGVTAVTACPSMQRGSCKHEPAERMPPEGSVCMMHCLCASAVDCEACIPVRPASWRGRLQRRRRWRMCRPCSTASQSLRLRRRRAICGTTPRERQRCSATRPISPCRMRRGWTVAVPYLQHPVVVEFHVSSKAHGYSPGGVCADCCG